MLRKHARDEVSDSQIDQLIFALIGSTDDSIAFRLFKQLACEGKISCHHSNLIKRKLHLSSSLGLKVDALIILMFLYLFKKMIWIPRCALQIKWEDSQDIDRKLKMTNTPRTAPPSTIKICHPNTSRQEITNNLILREVDVAPIQILDDLPIFEVEPEQIERTEQYDRTARKLEAARMTWIGISNYVQHYYLEEWVPRLSKYLNKITMIGDEIWDTQ